MPCSDASVGLPLILARAEVCGASALEEPEKVGSATADLLRDAAKLSVLRRETVDNRPRPPTDRKPEPPSEEDPFPNHILPSAVRDRCIEARDNERGGGGSRPSSSPCVTVTWKGPSRPTSESRDAVNDAAPLDDAPAIPVTKAAERAAPNSAPGIGGTIEASSPSLGVNNGSGATGMLRVRSRLPRMLPKTRRIESARPPDAFV